MILQIIPTVRSFVELVRYVFTIPGVSVFLTCQDPLENFFGQQRQRGRVHDNPSIAEFMTNTQALRVMNGVCGNARSLGNCRGQIAEENCETPPLPKRRSN